MEGPVDLGVQEQGRRSQVAVKCPAILSHPRGLWFGVLGSRVTEFRAPRNSALRLFVSALAIPNDRSIPFSKQQRSSRHTQAKMPTINVDKYALFEELGEQ